MTTCFQLGWLNDHLFAEELGVFSFFFFAFHSVSIVYKLVCVLLLLLVLKVGYRILLY